MAEPQVCPNIDIGSESWNAMLDNRCVVCPFQFSLPKTIITLARSSVPVSRLPQLVLETKRDLADAGLSSTIVGHVGDGNFHALILFRDDEELERVSSAVHRLVHRAIALDGTCKLITVWSWFPSLICY
jgi:FAD/FMN-containing dehydrogenase